MVFAPFFVLLHHKRRNVLRLLLSRGIKTDCKKSCNSQIIHPTKIPISTPKVSPNVTWKVKRIKEQNKIPHDLQERIRYKRALKMSMPIQKEGPNFDIYCKGPLLHTVQMALLYQDSKTFVDMKLKNSPDKTLEDFSVFMNANNNAPSTRKILEFVESHFDDVGKEFVEWIPNDWVESPQFLEKINDPDLRQWGADLNAIWKELGRKMTDDVHLNANLYSIIPVNNPVIVPGGRFREFYYWDSYWIIRGLLFSEMYDTAHGMLKNFLSIVQRFGFIPNGGRIYYAYRSHPPLLTPMIKSYVEFTKDYTLAIDALSILEHEFQYWMNNHIVQANGHALCAYGDKSTGPRPESYREDLETAESFATEEAKENHFSELKAACESGMDFSSRWFIAPDGTNSGNLTNLKTRSIVPVELNAILYWNAKILAEFNTKAGLITKAAEYEAKAQYIFEAIQAVHWNEEVGCWLDYDLINNKHRNYFSPTNLSPLWTMAFNKNDSEKISASVLRYISNLNLDDYPGGVPNSLNNTGEQWDFPNVWPPMQYIMVEGLGNLGTPKATRLSKRWGHLWVKSNFKAYKETRSMFEKYDCETYGGHGGGGEYEIQTGFGWSNGVIIEYLVKYGRELSFAQGDGTATSAVEPAVTPSTTMVGIIIRTFATMLATSIARVMW